jgi:o-succinylbenzoate synthase
MAVIVDARVARFSLPLREPLRTTRGAITSRPGALLRLRTDDGLEGWGEATPVPGFPGPDAITTARVLEASARGLVGADSETLWPPPIHPTSPAAAFAIETALADLAAVRAALPMARWLGGAAASERVAVNALIADADDARVATAKGFKTLKCKVGADSLEHDMDRLREIREAAPQPVRLRADANQAWSVPDARRALEAFSPLGLEYVEEPLRDPSPSALAMLARQSGVAIASDESAVARSDFEALLATGAVSFCVLKPSAIGGLVETRLRAQACRQAGVEVVVTTGLDGAIAGLACLHVAASLGALPACGLATAHWLERYLCVLPPVQRGELAVPRSSGLGTAPDSSYLAELGM